MSKAEAFWDKASQNYDKSEERFEYIHNRTRENTEAYLNLKDVVLDYGCGTGTKSCEFAKQVKEIHAIDISSEMIEIAKKKAAISQIQNVNFEQTAIFDNKYKKESFDVILAFNMLHTVNNPDNVLQRIHELLKADGVFISATPCLQDKKSFLVSLQIYLVRVLSKIRIIPIPIRRYRSSELDDLLESGNFKSIKTEKIFKGASSYFIVAKKAG